MNLRKSPRGRCVRPLCAAISAAAAALLVCRVGASQEAPSPRRVEEIAAMLPERPAGVGRPVTDRAAWEELASHESYKGVVRRAERHLGQPVPDLPDELFLDFSRTGNRSRWQRVAGRRNGRFDRLVLAECLEDEGRFLPALEDTVRAICAEKTWVMPAHDGRLTNFNGTSIDIDLRSASLSWDLATAHYLLEARLGAETRELIIDNVRRRVFDPYRDMVAGERKANWWMRTTNNWNAVCLAGVTGAALAVVEDRSDRALFCAAAEKYSESFLRGFGADGYCTEGLGYWNYGFGHYVVLAETVFQATGGGVDLLDREAARLPATFGARIEIAGGVYPAFADCGVTTRPSARTMSFVSRRRGLGLRRWEERVTVSPRGGPAEAMLFSRPNSVSYTPLAEPASAPGRRDWFDEAGILVCRPGGRGACEIAAALKGGHNGEHHNHNDVGSYVAVVGGGALLVDPGGEVYTARTFSKRRYESKVLNSWGHPVPVVAGKLQRTGREARARVLRTDFTDRRDELVLDISSAYEVPELSRLTRTFVYSREGRGSLTVTDDVAFAEPKEFGTALVTLGRWLEVAPGELVIFDVEGAVRVRIDTGGVEFDVVAKPIEEDVRTRSRPTRIGIDLARPVAEARVALRIEPANLPAEAGGGGLLRNGGFELGSWAWSVPKGDMGSVSDERAAGGKSSLRILDDEKTRGSNVSSARVRIDGPGTFELSGKVFPVSGDGVGVYVKFLDAGGRQLNEADERGWISSLLSLGGSDRRWKPFRRRFETPAGTVFLQVWIHSYGASVVEAYLDDMEIVSLED